jgi:predicted enzyme related to lactoylglutathione lyase
MSHGFVRWELRTIDVGAARSFYEAILEGGPLEVTALPEVALSRGAKPHWLGHLSAADAEAMKDAFVARGAMRLGNGQSLKDPSGAVLTFTSETTPQRTDVVWQQLLTSDPRRAEKDYGELLGMSVRGPMEVPGHGTFDTFSWGDGPTAGAVGDITGKPHIHPQWLFFFRVSDLAAATAQVKELGGLVIGPTALPDGRRVAVCDDPQGAAFALMQLQGA